ncbi:hypothetical protein NXW92_14715 [Bacteroides fragilis]|nr:hypothetical protein [Bacteroides fragilis]
MGLDIAIASAVVEIITLIFFFVLCRNVSKIKKEIVTNDNLPGMFAMYISLGETDKAKKILYKTISKEPEFIAAFCYNGNNSAQQSTLKRKYKPDLEALGLELDFELVNKFIQEREK